MHTFSKASSVLSLSLLLLIGFQTSCFAVDPPNLSGSTNADGINLGGAGSNSSNSTKTKVEISQSETSSHTTAFDSALGNVISKISLQIGRNDYDSTEPRLGTENSSVTAMPLSGKECVTNDGKGANGKLVAIPLPLGQVEGTGSYDTDAVGNFGCLPSKGGGKKTVTVVNPVTGKAVKVEPIVISVSHEDFENQPIKPASLTMDNAPNSLKNYNTNIFAKSGEQRFNDNIMGENVEIKAIPISYTFNYGDGTTVTTTNPGYSVGSQWDVRTPTSHQYKKPGKYTYTVTTTFRGEFRVPGGPWQVVPGTSNRVSAPQGVDVWRVKAGNVEGK